MRYHILSSSVCTMIFTPSQVGLKFGDRGIEVSVLKNFLLQYGYFEYTDSTIGKENEEARTIELQSEIFDESIENAVMQFQEFNRINISGILDKETVRLMQQPRCGVIDIKNETNFKEDESNLKVDEDSSFLIPNNGIFFRYYSGRPKWNKFNLTYSIRNFTQDIQISKESQVMAIVSGLEQWANVTPFKFERVDRSADLNFIFSRRRHNFAHNICPVQFEGLGGQVAHAFPPTYGEVHFDDDEIWWDRPDLDPDCRDLYAVAVHEIGHLLGMDHSSIPDAIMYAYHQNGKRILTEDDIKGITNLYPL